MQHRQLNHQEVKQKFSEKDVERAIPLVLIANNLKSSENLGALFRLADAAGIRQIYTYGEAAHNLERIRKVARSAQKNVQLVELREESDLVSLKKQYDLVALEITSDSFSYREYRPERPVALIIGNEKDGISREILKKTDLAIHIPMYGQGSSMNVSMAAGIAVYGIRPHLPKIQMPNL